MNLALAERLRLSRGLSFAEIARRIKVDDKTVTRWFAGKQDVAVHNRPALARVLGCKDVHELFGADLNSADAANEQANFDQHQSSIIPTATGTDEAEIEVEFDEIAWTEEMYRNLLAAIRNLHATSRPFLIRFPRCKGASGLCCTQE